MDFLFRLTFRTIVSWYTFGQRLLLTDRDEVGALTRALEVSLGVFFDILSEWWSNVSSIVTLTILSVWRTPCSGVVTTCGMLDFNHFGSEVLGQWR